MKAKLISIALVLVLLVAALMQISGVVHDRQTYRKVAIESVANSLAGAQTLTGPLIHMACVEEWDSMVDKQLRADRREFHLVAAPTTLSIQGSSQLEPRARGLHATQAFNLKARLKAQWTDLESLRPVAQHANSRMSCGQPLLMMAVSDARGIRHAGLRLGEQPLSLKPGTFYGRYPRGVHAPLPSGWSRSAPLEAQLDLELVGTEQLSIVPLGGDTQIKLSSNWPHPSFGGQFLPVERKITDQGFDASWRVSALASTAQQDVARSKDVAEAVAVTFVDPGNTYALSDRATKYGLLFIGLTFLAVGLFEFMKSLRVHPIQYLLVGAAMSMFFLLLVSLSEHMPFGMAYAISAAACVLLLTYYASHMLHSWARGVPFGIGIGALYGMLFVLLQMEQTALVMGAVGLFLVLAAVMLMTRRIDWYARFGQARPVDGGAN
ncbi:cell envelope integrity protein CreD [Polaromonas sp.]|uniref:cell envelope integrity protein CreD n=1 Tax=Polaromonas sp. TaxID=1869339 RepID=UPI003BAC0F43